MGKVKELQQKVIDECYAMYESTGGYSAVIDFINEQQRIGNSSYTDVKFERCNGCDNNMPSLNSTCLICGQETKPNYFNIIHQGYNKELDREEIQVHAGENGNIFLIKTKTGFIVDVYNQEDNVNTMSILENDLTGDDDVDISDDEINQFKEVWGQKHNNICDELGYSRKESDDLLMFDYFWIQNDKQWFPILSSMYTKREQQIADHIRTKI